jgi:hypothetical protein
MSRIERDRRTRTGVLMLNIDSTNSHKNPPPSGQFFDFVVELHFFSAEAQRARSPFLHDGDTMAL